MSKIKPPVSDNLLIKRIQSVVAGKNYSEEVSHILVNTFKYMRAESFIGGCHALSSVLYVALNEVGLTPELLVGECQKPGDKPFDHSWIMLNGMVLDIAIYMPLTMPINSTSGPVIFNTDVVTMMPVKTAYGINTGIAMGNDAIFAMQAPFCEYMTGFPMERGGLWTVVQSVLPAGVAFDKNAAMRKYENTKRIFVR